MAPITLMYSEMNKSFMSMLSSRPTWYLDFGGRYFSIDSSNSMRIHNKGSKYNQLSGSNSIVEGVVVPPASEKSLIKFVVNNDYAKTKVFDNASYSADFSGNNNLSDITYKTSTQQTNPVSLISRREDTFMISIPRNNVLATFSDRMRGKYLICNYSFNDASGSKFTLPYIETDYRYSSI